MLSFSRQRQEGAAGLPFTQAESKAQSRQTAEQAPMSRHVLPQQKRGILKG